MTRWKTHTSKIPFFLPNMSAMEDTQWMFYDCVNYDQDMSSWDLSKVNNMWEMFEGTTKFTGEFLIMGESSLSRAAAAAAAREG